MSHHTLQRLSVIAASMLLLHAPLGAKNKCKTFSSLVVKCALTTAQLTVNGNANITGNLTVGGTITATGGITAPSFTTAGGSTLGDLLAYATFVNTTVGPVTIATNVSFPTPNPANSSNITIDGTNSIFTVSLAGTYLVLYQVTGTVAGTVTQLQLEQAPAATGIFAPVPTGAVEMAVGTEEVSNATIVRVGAGDKFELFNNQTAITLIPGPLPGNSAAITFLRLHA